MLPARHLREGAILSARTGRLIAVVVSVAAAVGMVPVAASPAAAGPDGEYLAYGPADPYEDAMMPWHGPVEPMKDKSAIDRTRYGYMLISGQQHNRLVVRYTKAGRLHFRDRGTRSWKRVAKGCRVLRVSRGVAATCPVPNRTSVDDALLLEIQTRLGNDLVDTSALPAKFEAAVLGDEGNDVIRTGAGNDYITGAQDRDRISGGPGNDWLRSGLATDVAVGGSGNDLLVGNDASDSLYGGRGDDKIYGSGGNDLLDGGRGQDRLYGGPGRDTATLNGTSRAWTCEVLTAG